MFIASEACGTIESVLQALYQQTALRSATGRLLKVGGSSFADTAGSIRW
jgi:hypothetical protein